MRYKMSHIYVIVGKIDNQAYNDLWKVCKLIIMPWKNSPISEWFKNTKEYGHHYYKQNAQDCFEMWWP